MERNLSIVAAAGLLFLAAVAVSQCSAPATPATPPAATTPFGRMTPVVSVKELMAHMIDPIADNIFDAVWSDSTAKGIVDHRPTTDEDWEKVKTGAVTLAEGIYLLKIPRPITPAGDVNNSTGPNPPELSPVQIKEKLDKDPVQWEARIEALRNAALAVLEVVKKKDVDGLFDAGGNLDEACEQCHLEYWYPGDRAAVLAQKNARAGFARK